MNPNPKRLVAALLIFAAWAAITVAGGAWQGGGHAELGELVSHGPLWAIVAAAVFLAVVTVAGKWSGIGWTAPAVGQAVRLSWVPLGYIAVFVVLALQVGLPPGGVVFWALANSLMVGLSEEWMCRGILLRGLEDGTGSLRKAVWGSSVLFGAVHSLNVFVTGDLVPGLIQSGAAFMSGLLFCALRLRTGSLLPVIAVHGLWDASLFIMAQAMAVKGAEKTASVGVGMFAPMLLVLPNFLYALYLLRKVGRDVPAGGAVAAGR